MCYYLNAHFQGQRVKHSKFSIYFLFLTVLKRSLNSFHTEFFFYIDRHKECLRNILQCKVHLCTGRTHHRGSRGIALPFHDHGSRRGWGVSVTPRPLFTPGKTGYKLHRSCVGPRACLDKCEKSRTPTGIRSPDRPALSQLLYRLSYRAYIL